MKWFKCVKCGAKKQETEFYHDKQKPSGYKPRCKSCEKLYKNMELRREYEKHYYQKRKFYRAKIVKKSMLKNKEHHSRIRKQYLNTDNGKANHKRHGVERSARMRGAFVEHVDTNELYKEFKGICFYCGVDTNFKHHIDHFIPISKGGKHKKSNLRISCQTCNLQKGAKLPFKEVPYQMV